MADAKLFEVQTMRGTVYALLDVASGMIWTERSEQAARRLAADKRLSIVQEQSISHEELLRLMGHEPIRKKPESAKVADVSAAPTEDVEPGVTSPQPVFAPASPVAFPVKYHLEDEPDIPLDAQVISLPASERVGGFFFSEGEIVPKVAPDEAGDEAHKKPAG
jgi:hypothetical protein